MQVEELRKHAKCSICGNKIGKSGLPVFYTFKIVPYYIDGNAIQRHSGLEMMLGSPALAQVMCSGEDMANKGETIEGTICFGCINKPIKINEIIINS